MNRITDFLVYLAFFKFFFTFFFFLIFLINVSSFIRSTLQGRTSVPDDQRNQRRINCSYRGIACIIFCTCENEVYLMRGVEALVSVFFLFLFFG